MGARDEIVKASSANFSVTRSWTFGGNEDLVGEAEVKSNLPPSWSNEN